VAGVALSPMPISSVTVAALSGTAVALFTFDAAISSCAFGNFPRSGDASVTVAGLSFGMYDFTASVTMSLAMCSSTSWSSSTSVLCNSPVAVLLAPQLDVTVGVVVGTVANPFTFDAPVVSSVGGNTVRSGGGGSVTVSGLNFAWVEPTASFLLSLAYCSCVSWTSASSSACRVGVISNDVAAVVVPVDVLAGTLFPAFTFDAPVHSAKSLPNVATTAAGLSTSVTGLNFGLRDYTPTSNLGSFGCSTQSWLTGTVLRCLDNTGVGGDAPCSSQWAASSELPSDGSPSIPLSSRMR